MPAIGAGDLIHRVRIERNAYTQDATTGEMVTSWQTVAHVWAQVVPLSGREFMASASEQSEVRARIVIRARDDVEAGMRVIHRGKYYAILAALPDVESGREHLSLMVAEGVRLEQ